MPSLKDIRSRIDSTKNTQQITRAMKMTSAAKLRRAQQNIVNMRPYARAIYSVIADIASAQHVEHPLLDASHAPSKVLLIVMTSDRGLCGGFNSTVNRFALNYYKENKPKLQKLDFLFIGRKASDYFRRLEITGIDTILNLDKEISYKFSTVISERLVEDYVKGDYDEVRVVYNEFLSAISQVTTCERLLPIDITAAIKAEEESGTVKDFIFEPAPEEIIKELLRKHFEVQVYRCLSESLASEHGARMTAMENATKNAGEMISALTLAYNKARQANITTELIEITSGAEALKG
jgi:F-type H+-transporting ATPase subunit gamma